MLEVSNLSVAYGGLRALTDVTLLVKEGQFVTVVGPNGAGKSTLFKTISGIVRPAAGQITFLGRNLFALPPARRAHLGIAHVPEGRQVFPLLSVRDNMRLGAIARRDFDPAEIEGMCDRFPRLRPLLDRPAGLLSGGEQQMLALARGLLARPALLLRDEPSLGLAPAVAQDLFDALSRLRDEGMTLLLVDQMADLALPLADRCVVLSNGRIGRTGPAAELGAALDYLGTAA